ncbi:MAG: hypothetical protein Q9P14_07050 [candidate division KSB1 bacterium]|nr:hypothetical protein [candidate division KSB1 bacterium]MDQ7063443.1 hypothetical protein [candidate division KSB1 bacterium]
MKLNFLTQVIDAYYDFIENNTDDCRNDFDGSPGEVEDPMGGWEGITEYDEKNLDEDYD